MTLYCYVLLRRYVVFFDITILRTKWYGLYDLCNEGYVVRSKEKSRERIIK